MEDFNKIKTSTGLKLKNLIKNDDNEPKHKINQQNIYNSQQQFIQIS